ncbi:MAG: DNA-binding response regulator, partial [Gammaproteobacteria bacterium]|nr:DNA-binding response regulator [Gammaproteobacteria bacterium]
ALGLTTHGVRYHIRNIFGKLRVRNRRDAIRRARVIGLLPSYE